MSRKSIWHDEIAERYRDEHRRASELHDRLTLPATLVTVFFGAIWILARSPVDLTSQDRGDCATSSPVHRLAMILLTGALLSCAAQTARAALLLFKAYHTGRYGFTNPQLLMDDEARYVDQMLEATRLNIRTNRIRSELLGSAMRVLFGSFVYLLAAGLFRLLT